MGNIDLNYFCDVSSVISKHAKGYDSTQGYTVGDAGKQVVVALNDDIRMGKIKDKDKDKYGGLLQFSASGSYEKASLDRGLGHGNGCTYYDGYYYVVKGGGKDNETARIVRLNAEFEYDRKYDCMRYDASQGKDVKQNVSSITHLKDDFFILAKGEKAFVCRRYNAINGDNVGTFKVFSSFVMDDDGKVKNAFGTEYPQKDRVVPQSIYYSKKESRLYRIVSYKDVIDNKIFIQKNTISKFSLSGGPSYNSAKLEGIYKNTRTDIPLFEIEAMSADSSGTKYISTNISDEKGDDCDAIFKINLT